MRRRKPPRAAVVAIGRTSEEISYAEILRKARTDISLSQLGIEKSKVRLAKSGDVLIEVYGEGKKDKAGRLANRLANLTKSICKCGVLKSTARCAFKSSTHPLEQRILRRASELQQTVRRPVFEWASEFCSATACIR